MLREAVRDALGAKPRNLAALAAAGGLLLVAHLLVRDPVIRYGVWLLVFSIWMLWFVLTAVDVLAAGE